jgi:BTB/POZ domain-containing protein 7
MLTQTPYSVNRKNVRKRDVSDVEMREILTELLPFLRVDHVIPPNSELLNQAIRRGLVCTPPSHMINPDQTYNKKHAWIRSPVGIFVRPRLFMPYYEEIKVRT